MDELTIHWKAQLDAFIKKEKYHFDVMSSEYENTFDAWWDYMIGLMTDAVNETNTWTEKQKKTILDWFAELQVNLSGDVATNLQLQINKADIERMLLVGLDDGVKTFSEDGSIITTVDKEGRTLTKTFTNNFLRCETILTDHNGGRLGGVIKEFSPDGTTISSTMIITS
jgi:hypothetical protein